MNNNNITFTIEQQTALLTLTKTFINEYSDFTMNCAQLLHKGLIFIDENDLPMSSVPTSIAREAVKLYGYSNEDFNNTLIDSFATITDMTEEEFYTIQILHYLTTYVANFTTPFIVGARQYTPDETKALKITIIKAISDYHEVVNHINDLFTNTAAPKSQNVPYYRALASLTTIAPEAVKSKELMAIICAERGIRPSNPEILLRYLVYITTEQTLLIKNNKLINSIKYGIKQYGAPVAIIQSLTEDEMKRLASIFYRYKPIFLAFKTPGTSSTINRIRRLAVKYHKPQSALTLKNFVALAREGKKDEVETLIARSTNRELIKLHNAINTWIISNSRVYQIRNGKMWVDESKKDELHGALEIMNLVSAKAAITKELKKRLKNYKNLTFYMPCGISYTVPYSEKQFSGAIPWGTKIYDAEPEDAYTLGVHWVNDLEERHCDLDLHAHTPTQHIGWNGTYYSKDGELLYSGDMTDAPAPLGAAESFYINNIDEPVILSLNAYSAKPDKDFQFFITRGKDNEMRERATFDASKLITAPLPLVLKDKDAMSLGIFKDKEFYIYGGNLAANAVPSANYPMFIEGIMNRVTSMYSFEVFLLNIGAKIVYTAPKSTPFVDLTPEALTVNTLLDIVDGNAEKWLREPAKK